MSKLALSLHFGEPEEGGTVTTTVPLDAPVRTRLGNMRVWYAPGQPVQVGYAKCLAPFLSLQLPPAVAALAQGGGGGETMHLFVDMQVVEHSLRRKHAPDADADEPAKKAAKRKRAPDDTPDAAADSAAAAPNPEPPKKRVRKPLTDEQKEARRQKRVARNLEKELAAASAADAAAGPTTLAAAEIVAMDKSV